jgi:hypothetical protein
MIKGGKWECGTELTEPQLFVLNGEDAKKDEEFLDFILAPAEGESQTDKDYLDLLNSRFLEYNKG